MLTLIALRLATIHALKGRTLVGDNVIDSKINAVDVSADGAIHIATDKPFIAVYTDGSAAQDGLASRNLHKLGRTDLVLETGIATPMTENDETSGESRIVGFGIPATDGAFEFFLDLIGHQIASALADPTNAWAEVWKGLTAGLQSIERKRVSDAESGVRMAAHQLVYGLELTSDPISAEDLRPTSALARFLDLAETVEDDEVLAEVVVAIRAALSGASFEWQGNVRRYGLTHAEGDALLVTAADGAEADIDVGEINAAPVEQTQP